MESKQLSGFVLFGIPSKAGTCGEAGVDIKKDDSSLLPMQLLDETLSLFQNTVFPDIVSYKDARGWDLVTPEMIPDG